MFDLDTLKAVARSMGIAILALVIAGAILWQVSEYGDNCINGYEETNCTTESDVEIGEPLTVVCTEDMPCWDCETMGNLICGKDNG